MLPRRQAAGGETNRSGAAPGAPGTRPVWHEVEQPVAW